MLSDVSNFSFLKIQAMSIRVTILSGEEKKLKRKKTGSKKCTRTVHFNEQLAFNLPRQALCDVLLEIEVG